jgi:hypothetical protein
VIQVGDGLAYGDNKRTIVLLIVMDSEFAKFSLSWAAGLPWTSISGQVSTSMISVFASSNRFRQLSL